MLGQFDNFQVFRLCGCGAQCRFHLVFCDHQLDFTREREKKGEKTLNSKLWNAMILEKQTWKSVQAFFKTQYIP
jgi:hypothetical protein